MTLARFYVKSRMEYLVNERSSNKTVREIAAEVAKLFVDNSKDDKSYDADISEIDVDGTARLQLSIWADSVKVGITFKGMREQNGLLHAIRHYPHVWFYKKAIADFIRISKSLYYLDN